MPDKNLSIGQRVQIVGNVYDDDTVVAFFTACPLLQRFGTIAELGVYDEEWGDRWYVQTRAGRLLLSEMDLSPLTDMSSSPTNRGFGRSEFTDLYGSECSIQESSLATEGAIWLGVNDDGHFNMKTPPEKWDAKIYERQSTGGRMHLSRGMAAALLPILTHFVEHGTLPAQAGDDHGT